MKNESKTISSLSSSLCHLKKQEEKFFIENLETILIARNISFACPGYVMRKKGVEI